MKSLSNFTIILLLSISSILYAQNDSIDKQNANLEEYKQKFEQIEQQRLKDSVRISGEVKKEYADILRLADDIFMQELRASGWYDKTAQAFAVFQPVKSVGVVGDGRRYAWVIALRAVETVDFMTARFAHLPYDLVDKISTRIMNEIKDVSRVYIVTGKQIGRAHV